MREVQTQRVIVETDDEIAERAVWFGGHRLAVRDPGGDDAELVRSEAEAALREDEVGPALKLQENLRSVMVVHVPPVLDGAGIARDPQAQLIAGGEADRFVQHGPHFRPGLGWHGARVEQPVAGGELGRRRGDGFRRMRGATHEGNCCDSARLQLPVALWTHGGGQKADG